HSSDSAQEDGSGRTDPVAGAGDGNQAGQEAVDREAHVPLLAHHVSGEHGGQTSSARRKRCIRGDSADALEVHRGKGAAGVEAVPAEPEEKSARCRNGQVMRHHRTAAVTLECASKARPKYDRTGQCYESADGVYYCRAGEIMKRITEVRKEVACASHRREEPVRAPGPVTDDRIDESGNTYAVEQVAHEPGAADHRAGGDRGAG